MIEGCIRFLYSCPLAVYIIVVLYIYDVYLGLVHLILECIVLGRCSQHWGGEPKQARGANGM